MIHLKFNSKYIKIDIPYVYIDKEKMYSLVNKVVIFVNIYIQRYKPELIILKKCLRKTDYCQNCLYVFDTKNFKEPRNWKNTLDGKSYCLSCPNTTNKINGFSIFYKRGNRVFGEKEYRKIIDGTKGMEADLIQPTRKYNSTFKTWETNPDYVKIYGDPYKEK